MAQNDDKLEAKAARKAEKAAKKAAKKKKSTIKQVIEVYKFTHADDKALPAIMAATFLGPVVLFVVLGLLLRWSPVSWVLLMILAIMVGLLLSVVVLTRRADAVGYRKMEGRSGAAIAVIRGISKAGYQFPEQPIWVDPKTKDAVWRGTGYNGIYLLGEGNYARVSKAMDNQERSIKSVTAGSSIPVYRICVGNGPEQVRLRDLRKTVMKKKAYRPTSHKNPIMKKLHSRSRFVLTKTELATLNERLNTLQSKSGYGIPKGIDPMRRQRVSRRALRGR